MPQHQLAVDIELPLPMIAQGYQEIFNSPYCRLLIAKAIHSRLQSIGTDLSNIPEDCWDTFLWGNRVFGFNVFRSDTGEPLADIYMATCRAIQADMPVAIDIPIPT